jgi:hypothetical protein
MFATGVNITVYYGGLVGSGQHLGGCAVMVMMALRSGVGLMLVDRRLKCVPVWRHVRHTYHPLSSSLATMAKSMT